MNRAAVLGTNHQRSVAPQPQLVCDPLGIDLRQSTVPLVYAGGERREEHAFHRQAGIPGPVLVERGVGPERQVVEGAAVRCDPSQGPAAVAREGDHGLFGHIYRGIPEREVGPAALGQGPLRSGADGALSTEKCTPRDRQAVVDYQPRTVR